jgi:hypothetical protein
MQLLLNFKPRQKLTIMSEYKLIAKKVIDTEIVRENSYSRTSLGSHTSTMELWKNEEGEIYIEWDVPSLDETQYYGFTLEGKTVLEFDGAISIPQEAIQLLEENGYNANEIKD